MVYAWLIQLLIIFIFYQLYRITPQSSPRLITLTIFDAFVVWLTWHELRKGAGAAAQPVV